MDDWTELDVGVDDMATAVPVLTVCGMSALRLSLEGDSVIMY